MSRELSVEEIEDYDPNPEMVEEGYTAHLPSVKLHALCQLALRAKAAEQRAGEWRSISSAPKDGSYFLSISKDALIPQVIHWDFYGGEKMWTSPEADGHYDRVTHWMPLPEPPKSTPALGEP